MYAVVGVLPSSATSHIKVHFNNNARNVYSGGPPQASPPPVHRPLPEDRRQVLSTSLQAFSPWDAAERLTEPPEPCLLRIDPADVDIEDAESGTRTTCIRGLRMKPHLGVYFDNFRAQLLPVLHESHLENARDCSVPRLSQVCGTDGIPYVTGDVTVPVVVEHAGSELEAAMPLGATEFTYRTEKLLLKRLLWKFEQSEGSQLGSPPPPPSQSGNSSGQSDASIDLMPVSDATLINYYTKARVDVTRLGPMSESLLHWTALLGRVQCSEWLLDQGIHATAKDATDTTPLHLATFARNYKLVKVLLRAGADPHAVPPL